MSFATLSLALAACSVQSTPRYVVRLDLDKIAAQTAAKSPKPGFTELRG